MILALSGGTGGAKMLDGLAQVRLELGNDLGIAGLLVSGHLVGHYRAQLGNDVLAPCLESFGDGRDHAVPAQGVQGSPQGVEFRACRHDMCSLHI